MNLRAKLGPLPRWAWLLILVAVVYLLWRKLRPGTATGVQSSLTTIPLTSAAAGVAGSDLGLQTSAGSPADSGSATSDLLNTFSASQEGLFSALSAANEDIVQLASAQIAAAQMTGLGSFQTQTQPVGAQQPGGANAPTITYVSPTVMGGVSSPPAAQPAARSSAVTTPTRYYTHYTQAQKAAKQGQTVHFHSGKGYYLV